MQKKQALIKAAANLFADQGFNGTTTFQIAKEAQVTEPLIYYHFKGKDELYTHILKSTFDEYFSRLKGLEKKTTTHFEKIENLIDLHFQIVKELPTEVRLILSTCPAKLKDSDGICVRSIERQRNWNVAYLTDCIDNGIKDGEFRKVPVKETVHVLTALINGLVRQMAYGVDDMPEMRAVVVGFCRRSLTAN